MKSKNSFTSVADILKKSLGKVGEQKIDSLIHLRNQWPTIVGPDIAKHCQVQFIKNNKLYVKVDSPSWKAELTMMKTLIIKKINAAKVTSTIEDLVIQD